MSPLPDRIANYIYPQPNGCWLWGKSTDGHGYGQRMIAVKA
jgi:hypothetical protein